MVFPYVPLRTCNDYWDSKKREKADLYSQDIVNNAFLWMLSDMSFILFLPAVNDDVTDTSRRSNVPNLVSPDPIAKASFINEGLRNIGTRSF